MKKVLLVILLFLFIAIIGLVLFLALFGGDKDNKNSGTGFEVDCGVISTDAFALALQNPDSAPADLKTKAECMSGKMKNGCKASKLTFSGEDGTGIISIAPEGEKCNIRVTSSEAGWGGKTSVSCPFNKNTLTESFDMSEAEGQEWAMPLGVYFALGMMMGFSDSSTEEFTDELTGEKVICSLS